MPDIKIYSFADEASPEVNLQIAAMKRNKLDGLEARKVDGQNISDITAEKAKEIRKKMDDAGLRTYTLGSPIGKIDIETGDFKAHIQKLKNTLEIANVLGAENIRIFSFYMPEGKEPEIFKNEVIDRMGQMLDIAKEYGVELCHENEKKIYGDNIERTLELLKIFPQLRGIFDPANFVQCGVDTLKAWEVLKPYIKYLHIKDARADGFVVPAGKGIGNVPFIVNDYILSGGKCFTIEPHLKTFDGLKELEEKGKIENIGDDGYKDNDTAFDAACNAFKEILKGCNL